MRFLTSQPRVAAVVAEFGLPTHLFDATGGAERSFLRGRFGGGRGDPQAGAGMPFLPRNPGRSAQELGLAAFERIVPGASQLSADDWGRVRGSHEYLGRPVIDWSIGEALTTVLSPEGYRFVADAFGYDAVASVQPRRRNAVHPRRWARARRATNPRRRDGCDSARSRRLLRGGGRQVLLRYELVRHDMVDGAHHLSFANAPSVRARRVVLTVPVPALEQLRDRRPSSIHLPFGLRLPR